MKPIDPIEEAIFAAAGTLTSLSQRATFLDQACGGNIGLRQRIESLLQADARASQFFGNDPLELGGKTIGQTVRPEPPPNEAAGMLIGRYKLLQKIGEGGMGVVYMAEQEEPVRRRVALKIIKLGMDTRQVVARFEAERQALALMDHPNIARVLDGGATETGRPYFVMELVQGVPITEFCDKNRLPMRQRLSLFILVCHAIQSAHQKGIIHRDIKPSNVLVTLHDGVPIPKVIDFGIAKAIHQKLTEKTLFTNFASMIGTPAYMSPEQAELTGLDTDTRTDIYALGVLLYELLTGSTPFPDKRLRSLGYGEIQRVIREEEPQRPSTRLSTMGEEQRSAVSSNCGEEFDTLNKLLRGDLDWIVMKCLEKDRQRRYESSSGLAADVQRYLSNEPVTARPASAGYRFRKAVSRNRTATLALASVLFILILSTSFSGWAFLRERNARLEATMAELARETASSKAATETVRAETIGAFIVGLLDRVGPKLTVLGHKDAIRAVLELADGTAAKLTNAPRTEVEIRARLGGTYEGALWDFASAERQFALMGRRSAELGEASQHNSDLARCLELSALLWKTLDTNQLEGLRRIADLAMARTPADTEVAAHALNHLCLYYASFDNPSKAEEIAVELIGMAPIDDRHGYPRMTALKTAAIMKARRGALQEADELAERLLATVQWEDDAVSTAALEAYAEIVSSGGRFQEAERKLGNLINGRSPDQKVARLYLTSSLGEVVARGGNWTRGAEILERCVANPLSNVGQWQLALMLTRLTGNPEKLAELRLRGLARFAGGSDPDTSRALAEGLLLDAVEPAWIPLLNNLLIHAKSGAPWTREWVELQVAMFEYRTFRFAESVRISSGFTERAKTVGPDPAIAAGHFLTACAHARLGRTTEAGASFRQGLKFLPLPSIRQDVPCPLSAEKWYGTCSAELLRREAARLLGTDAPADSLIQPKL